MRIFIGTEEIASLLTNLSTAFKELGHTVTTYVTAENRFYGKNKYDIVRGKLLNDLIRYSDNKRLSKNSKRYLNKIDEIISLQYLKLRNQKLIDEHDVFVFFWAPWVPESYLFPILKKKNKKIVCLHVGTDVRHISAFEQQYKIDTSGWEEFFQLDLLEPKIQKIRYQELYADMIYSVPDQAGLYLRSYNHMRVPMPKNNNIVFSIPARRVPLIIHAPSRSGIKGTDIINNTLAQLKTEGYEFDYKLIQNMPNEALLKLLTEADILCDELFLHGPGVLSAEAMAAGCAVATRCLNIAPFQPPVCSITPENLFNKLKLLITDIDYRVSLAKAGKTFVEEFNDPQNFAKKIIEDINTENVKPDYEPEFFIKEYTLPGNQQLSGKTKKLTEQVIKKYNLQQIASTYDLKKRGLI